MKARPALCWPVAATLLATAVAGCGRGDIQVYKVAKETPAASHEHTGPAGWEPAALGEMRVASFRVKGQGGKQADVSVIPLGGVAGREVDNVNRWRGQLGLPPLSEPEAAKAAEAVQIGGLPGQLFNMAGQNPVSGSQERILAAIARREGTAWFFKMSGDDALVAEQKPAFVEYMKSFSFQPTGEQTASEQSQLPPSHPPIGGQSAGKLPASHPPIGGSQLPPSHPAIDSAATAPATAPISSEGKPKWQVPDGWKEVAGGDFLVAKFLLAGSDNAQAAVNVSMSAGDGGGLAGNVNRWRGQLGLKPVDDSELRKLTSTIDTEAGKATLVDMNGTDPRTGQQTRLVGAVVPQGRQTWFYKLMGAESLVGANKVAFAKFVETAKYTP
jgi:hypothetical protein